mmetsp:Transcript_60820/g.144936  ORF Transcript_60820/g.144936 Transcript_60820/m.144936 type:complete len:88 (-) Transcript_60820:14-277(-)
MEFDLERFLSFCTGGSRICDFSVLYFPSLYHCLSGIEGVCGPRVPIGFLHLLSSRSGRSKVAIHHCVYILSRYDDLAMLPLPEDCGM